MQIVKGVMAGMAMKHGIGRVVKTFPPQARVTRKQKEQLSKLLSEARRKRDNGVNHAPPNGVHAEEAPVNDAPPTPPALDPTNLDLSIELKDFLKRLADDAALPKAIRLEAFKFLVY